MNKVAILLSAYNGDEYIEEQIRSIYNQTYKDFRLYVRDDGSAIAFQNQLKTLQKQYGFELILGENIGFVKSFMELLSKIEGAELYAFSDQDDIWLEDKLQAAVEWFEQENRERENKEPIPMLYHNAYNVVQSDKKVIDKFYFPDEGYDFRRSITENHYSGFSMVINRTLREYMLCGDSDKIGYHDWWAAMIVQAFGVAHSDDKVLALHRAHGENVTTFNWKTRVGWLKKTLTEESDIRIRCKEFKRCFYSQLIVQYEKVLDLFTEERYNPFYALRKSFFYKRWRPILSSELIVRCLMLIGKI